MPAAPAYRKLRPKNGAGFGCCVPGKKVDLSGPVGSGGSTPARNAEKPARPVHKKTTPPISEAA